MWKPAAATTTTMKTPRLFIFYFILSSRKYESVKFNSSFFYPSFYAHTQHTFPQFIRAHI